MIKETYYAVRIGIHGKHTPYLMTCDGGLTPRLFTCEKAAKDKACKASNVKVVKVELRELKK